MAAVEQESKVVAIVQARMGSTRLPGKVLMDLAGQTILERVVERLRRVPALSDIVIATTDSHRDDAIVAECNGLAVQCFRGSEEDVLDRYYGAACSASAAVIVRVTSDCPLIDPDVTGGVIGEFLEKRPDYASNFIERYYPRGLDTEVFSFDALQTAWREATRSYERAHVTPYIFEHPGKFRLLSVPAQRDYSQHRWTVDTPEDLALVRAIYERLGNQGLFGWQDVLALVEAQPELSELNRDIAQKAVHLG